VLGKFLQGLKVKGNGSIGKVSVFISGFSFLCDVVVEQHHWGKIVTRRQVQISHKWRRCVL